MNFLLGVVVGSCIGLLVAPAPGEQTRRELLEKAEELKQRGLEKGREQAGDLGRQVGERLFDKAVGEERSA